MAERFEGQSKPDKQQPLADHVVKEALAPRQQKAGNVEAEKVAAVSDDYWSRHMRVLGNGLAYTGQGIWNGSNHDAAHPLEFAGKMTSAFVTGALIRRFLPERGASKALAGTLMLGYFAYDGLGPVVKAWQAASDTKSDADLDRAARKLGNGLGLFVVDSFSGALAGYAGDKGMGRTLRARGIDNYLAFEKSRALSWSPENNALERNLKNVANTLDGMFDKAAQSVRPAEPLSRPFNAGEAKEAVVRSARLGAKSVEDSVFWRMGDQERTLKPSQQEGGFYRRGQQDSAGRRIGFSETIDSLLGANKDAADGMVSSGHKITEGQPAHGQAKGIAAGKFPAPEPIRGTVDASASSTPPAKPPVSPENDAAVFDKIATVAKRRQEAWTPEAVALADYQDMIKGPLWGVIDKSRPVPLYEPVYELPNKQLMAVTDQLTSKEDVRQVGQLLEDHASAALQNELGVPLVKRLNVTGEAYISALLQGMKRVGISEPFLEGKAVTKFSVGGADNYTQPHIFGQVDGAVTKYPRTQVELRGAFNNINGHEVYGHTGLFRVLAEFTPEQIKTIIPQAVENAMRNASVPAEAKVMVPGRGQQPIRQVLTDILIAQRNENTSDLGATAQTVLGPSDSLIVLLKSLRAGGMLESRSVMGSRFPDFYEVHGIDGWRLELGRQTIIERAKYCQKPGDQAMMLKVAEELGVVKDLVMRPGKTYVWASMDKKGEFLSLPRPLVDALAKELVVAQFETPLKALTDKKGTQHTTR